VDDGGCGDACGLSRAARCGEGAGQRHRRQGGVRAHLRELLGRPVASVPDFAYSEKLRSMRADWGNWDETRLDAYLGNPRQVLHGVKMYFKGLPDANDRAAVIGYLATLQ
jgi:cytochrome c2